MCVLVCVLLVCVCVLSCVCVVGPCCGPWTVDRSVLDRARVRVHVTADSRQPVCLPGNSSSPSLSCRHSTHSTHSTPLTPLTCRDRQTDARTNERTNATNNNQTTTNEQSNNNTTTAKERKGTERRRRSAFSFQNCTLTTQSGQAVSLRQSVRL